MVAPVMPKHESFWNAMGKRLREICGDLTDTGLSNLLLGCSYEGYFYVVNGQYDTLSSYICLFYMSYIYSICSSIQVGNSSRRAS